MGSSEVKTIVGDVWAMVLNVWEYFFMLHVVNLLCVNLIEGRGMPHPYRMGYSAFLTFYLPNPNTTFVLTS